MRELFRDLKAALVPKTVILRVADTLLGFLLAQIVLSGGIVPFGIAYAASGSLFGFAGAFFGCIALGRDVLRTLTACFMVRVFRWLLPASSENEKPLAFFLYTLWGTMLGALMGFFFSEYTPTQNMAFMLNGLVSGGLAWAFSISASAFSARPIGTVTVRYCCSLLSVSVLAAGWMGLGGLFESVGRTAFLFLALCLGYKCSFFYTLSTVAVSGLILCFFSPERIVWYLMLLLGTLLVSALHPFGKYGLAASYAMSTVVVWLLSQQAFPFWSALAQVGVGSLLFLSVPGKWLSVLTRQTVPIGGGSRRRTSTRFRFRPKGGTGEVRGAESVCRSCPKRIVCHSRFAAETAQAFDEIRRGVRENDLRPPREFLDRCQRFVPVIAALRAQEQTAYRLRFAKAFSQKEGELFCGDTAGGFPTSDERYVFTITDGMGSGTRAARQSVKAVRLMEHLTRNGLEQEDVLKVLNRNLLSYPEETVLGVDVACVDLKNGACDLYKAGAAPTYILRRGTVYEIGSETLPVGMLEQADVKHETCRLSENDYLILISDGVLGKDKKWLAEYLNRIPVPKDCVSLADGILREAKKAGRNRIDDLTVLAISVEAA